MGSRGPKPGFKQRRAEQAAAAAQATAPKKAAAIKPAAASPIPDAQPAVQPPAAPPAESPVAVAAPTPAPAPVAAPAPAPQPEAKPSRAKASKPVLSAADRENPDKLSGQALKDLAHRRGIAKSMLADMPDEKIRTELRYSTYRQYENEDAVA